MDYKMTPTQIKTKDLLENIHEGIISWRFLHSGEISLTLPTTMPDYYDHEQVTITRRGKVETSYLVKDGEIIKTEYF